MGEGLGLQKIIKATPSKTLVIRINLVFVSFFLVIYASLLLRPSSSVYFENAASVVRCFLRVFHHKMEKVKMEAILENTEALKPKPKRNLTMLEVPTNFIDEIGRGLKIGMVNFEHEDYSEWEKHGEIIPVLFERVSELFEWKHLFPEWIDEEEEIDGP